MAYESLTLTMLVSAPGDVLPADLQTVADTISRWNFRSGREMSTPVTVIPIFWSHHAYSVFGKRPQEALNEQLVDIADFGFAMFANHLGSDTGTAPSGTVEEIERLVAADKHVSIVRNTSVPLSPGREATEKRLKLEEYLEGVVREHQGLFYEYTGGEGLAGHLENLLAARAKAAALESPAAGVSAEELDRLLADGYRPSEPSRSGGVVPSTESESRQRTDSKGRLKISRHWYLLLTNRTGQPVKNVQFRYDETANDGRAHAFDIRARDHEPVPYLGPGSTARFPIMRVDGSADQALCVVSWHYADQEGEPLGGETFETRDTVRAV